MQGTIRPWMDSFFLRGIISTNSIILVYTIIFIFILFCSISRDSISLLPSLHRSSFKNFLLYFLLHSLPSTNNNGILLLNYIILFILIFLIRLGRRKAKPMAMDSKICTADSVPLLQSLELAVKSCNVLSIV